MSDLSPEEQMVEGIARVIHREITAGTGVSDDHWEFTRSWYMGIAEAILDEMAQSECVTALLASPPSKQTEHLLSEKDKA